MIVCEYFEWNCLLTGEEDDAKKKKKKRRKLEAGETRKRKTDSATKSPRKKRRKRERNEDGSEMSKTDAKKTLFERRNIRWAEPLLNRNLCNKNNI